MADSQEKVRGIAWENTRRCGLLVDFPADLTSEILKNDDVCSQYAPEEAYDALKSAHAFLTVIINELLENTEESEEKANRKLRLIWFLLHCCELSEVSNQYCISFTKESLYPLNGAGKRNSAGWIPKNYLQDFALISENGCYAEYYKNGVSGAGFKACDSGALFFDDRLTALGLRLFFNKVIQKRWYQKYDIGGRYSANTGLTQGQCKEVFDRADMRIFNCGDRLAYDVGELLVGYSDELKRYFMKIYNFVKDNYPDCMPYFNIRNYGVSISATFCVNEKHRMIGQINFGSDKNNFDAYIALTGKEMQAMLSDIDSFSEKIVMQCVHDVSCECKLCKNGEGQIRYRGKMYNRTWKNTENRFLIENEDDADNAIKCMKIKAECNMNTRAE